jgi:deazaflavin-dependent oxidoreductase (nitroreductase family)
MTTADARDPNDFNQSVIAEFRANEGSVSGPFSAAPLLLLTTIGARTGKARTTPVVFTRDGDRLVIVASKAGGSTHPHWYLNLVANPQVTVELPGDTFAARASVAEGEERERLYIAHATVLPQYAEYAASTERVIPVVTLDRVG